EKLKEEETLRFMEMSFRDGVLRTTGTDIDRLLPPLSRFGGGNRAQRKQEIIDKLLEFFDRYYGLGS
ncbi:MAG: restriction endonuclease subunit R, partial [Symbiobacteriaceae bacterium]|nr:restriction endonuclease subunit R [Symbiobacteriaceae bacterium]